MMSSTGRSLKLCRGRPGPHPSRSASTGRERLVEVVRWTRVWRRSRASAFRRRAPVSGLRGWRRPWKDEKCGGEEHEDELPDPPDDVTRHRSVFTQSPPRPEGRSPHPRHPNGTIVWSGIPRMPLHIRRRSRRHRLSAACRQRGVDDIAERAHIDATDVVAPAVLVQPVEHRDQRCVGTRNRRRLLIEGMALLISASALASSILASNSGFS